MNKKLLIGIGVVVVVGVVSILLIGGSKEEVKNSISDESVDLIEDNSPIVEAPTKGTDTMKAILTRGEDLECTISYIADQSTTTPTTGTFFTTKGKMRGDFLVLSQQQEVVSSMIMDSENMYTWTQINGASYGMKITLADLENSKSNDSSPEAHEAVPVDVKVDYECKPWTNVDGSIFVPPTDIIFKNYSDLMSTGMEYGTAYEEGVSIEGKSPCQLCAQVEGDGKAECMKAFSCQ